MKAISTLFVSGLLAASIVTVAIAAPHDASREYGLHLAEGGVAGGPRMVRPEPRDKRAFTALLATDANWRGIFDAATDVPSRLWGGSMYVSGANASAATAESAARSFIATHLDLLAPGTAMSDLQLVANVEQQGIRTVAFVQSAAGLRVLGGQLSVSFKNDRLFLLRSQALPNVGAFGVRAPLRTVDDATATSLASLWIEQVYGSTVASAVRGQTAILPIVRAGHPVTYQVVATVTVDAHAPRGRWDVYVDAASGKPVARRQLLRFGTGTVRYNAPERYPGSDRATYAVPFADYTVNGNDVQADANGVVSWSGSSAATVSPSLTSRYAYIDNAVGSLASFSQALASGGIFEWASIASEYVDAQISAFVHVNIAKRYALALDPNLNWTKQQIPVVVNEDGSCNAYSTGDDIHFLQKDDDCENTGRLADVVYHEFGHSFHGQQQIPGLEWDGALGEGVADYYAATITGDAGMGRGFFSSSPAAALRHVDPPGTERSWPEDLEEGNIHDNGLIIAGALWDLRKAAIADMGESAGIRYTDEVFLAIIRHASDMPSTFAEALAYDDNDGNIGNGTPNYCMLLSAFGSHGLAAASSLLDIGVPQFDGTTVTVQATPAEIEDCPAPTVTKATLEWKLREGAGGATLDMTASGNDYSAQIPAQNPGSVVRYQVSMTLSNGNTVRLPRNQVDPYYEYYVGAVEEVYCTDFEVDPGWTTSASGANNSWSVGTPSAGASNGEPTSAVSGSKIFTLGLGMPYQPSATYTALAPTIPMDITRYAKIRIQYQRWLGVEDSTFDSANVLVGNTPVWTNKQGVGSSNHSDNEWRFHDIDITANVAAAAFGSETNFALQVGVNLKSDEGLELAGWALDDFCVVGVLAGDICTGDDCIEPTGSENGCCSANQGFASPLLLALAALGLMFFRRRRA
ncbi:MAG: hypothetical protein IPL79_18765 [Myxococcales bacterium]|nr:hypothetical protein [Myxococcales bacterium]